MTLRLLLALAGVRYGWGHRVISIRHLRVTGWASSLVVLYLDTGYEALFLPFLREAERRGEGKGAMEGRESKESPD